VAVAARSGPVGFAVVVGGGRDRWIPAYDRGRSVVVGSPLLLLRLSPHRLPVVDPCPPGGRQVDLIALRGGAAPGSRRWGGACWGRFSGRGAMPFGAMALSTAWWGGRRVLWMSDGHPLPCVELHVVSPASMEEGGKALSAALEMESLGTLWLRRSA
jgi:hypothetical protein